MSAHAPSLYEELEAVLKRTRGDVSFSLFLDGRKVESDVDLADLIALDGAIRMSLGLDVQLQDYLDGVPNLPARSEALDAAIDATLRSMVGSGLSPAAAAQTLLGNYPGLEKPIRDAQALTRAIGSTTLIRRAVAARRSRDVPCDFGSVTVDGRARFELRQLLGRGAHGDVYLACDRLLSDGPTEAMVAVKVFPRRLDGWWAEQRFVEEATKAHRIRHPNVVRVLDRGRTEEGEEYIVYELVSGGTLESLWLGRPAPTARMAAEVALKIARGVQAAHSAGVYHCDLKPANILVEADGEPRITDFGVAVRASDDFGAPDAEGSNPIGTLAFMSPEQFRMEDGSLGAPADIYALGAILFWLLTGKNPNGETAGEVARNLDGDAARTAAPSARALRPGVDGDLDAIVRRALAPAAAERHSAAATLADDLEAWLQRRPLWWRRPPVWRVAALWARRRPAVAALSALVVLVSVGGGWIAWSFAERARVRQIEVIKSRAALEQQEAAARARQEGIRLFRTQIEAVSRKGSALPLVWILEWLSGPDVANDPETYAASGAARIEIVRNIVEDKVAEGGEGSVEAVWWKTALAFWLIDEGQGAEALGILDAVEPSWEKWASAEDPWMAQVEALRACAEISAGARGPDGRTAPEARAGLSAQTEALERFLSTATGVDGIGMKALVKKHLEMVGAGGAAP